MVNMRDDGSLYEVQMEEPLGRVRILSYGSGHMLNDITSSCWFTYLLVFLTEVGLSPRYVLSGLNPLFSYSNI
jgi:Na+/melibiose symporter-like transporter